MRYETIKEIEHAVRFVRVPGVVMKNKNPKAELEKRIMEELSALRAERNLSRLVRKLASLLSSLITHGHFVGVSYSNNLEQEDMGAVGFDTYFSTYLKEPNQRNYNAIIDLIVDGGVTVGAEALKLLCQQYNLNPSTTKQKTAKVALTHEDIEAWRLY